MTEVAGCGGEDWEALHEFLDHLQRPTGPANVCVPLAVGSNMRRSPYAQGLGKTPKNPHLLPLGGRERREKLSVLCARGPEVPGLVSLHRVM